MTTIKGLLLGIFLVLLGILTSGFSAILSIVLAVAAIVVVAAFFYLGDD